jgi:hypothetical protein
MMSLPKYRTVTALLVAVFCIFNVGVPVVIAACPMTDTGIGGMCGLCLSFPDDGLPGYTTHQDRSCCETVLVSEGSGAEFLKAVFSLLPEVEFFCVASITPDLNGYSWSSVRVQPADASPGRGDLPVLLSSLLI